MNLLRSRMPQRWRPRVAATAWGRRVEIAALLGGWAWVSLMCWLVLSRSASLTFPTHVTVLLQSITPLAFLPVYLVLVVAIVRRRWVQSVAAVVLIVIHIASVAPALGSRELPRWTTSASRLRVLSANVYDANPTPAAAAVFLVRQPVDVLVLVEITRDMQRALDAAGVDDRFPFHQSGEFTEGTRGIEAIYSRRPLSGAANVSVGVQAFPTAAVEMESARLRLVAAHVEDPVADPHEWSTELDDLLAIARSESGPSVIAGDFNSTRWNPEFGALLGRGLHDADESRGQGLTFSWPENRLLPFPVMRLDHALGTVGAEAVHVRNVDVPGSDHRGLDVTWAVRHQ